MKTIIKIALATAIGFAVGCTHKFEEYNTDPNRIELGDIEPINLMEEMLFKAADGYLYRTYRINGEFMQYTVMTGTTDQFHRYIVPANDHQGAWNHLSRWAAHADHMYDLAVEREDANSMAIGLTLRAMFMCDLTSVYGDVPFTEAFQGRDGIKQPIFDTQEQIFTQIIADLKQANLSYNINKSLTIPTKDLLFGGNITKWRKFTNSVLVRVAMRIANIQPEVTKQILGEIVADPATYPLMETIDDQPIFRFTGEAPNVNRFGSTSNTAFTGINRQAAEHIISLMDASEDPRLGYYFIVSGGEAKGVVSGESYAATEESASGAAELNKPALGDYTSPYCFMPLSEPMFHLAEAAHLGYIDGGNVVAEEYFNKGVEASLRHWSLIEPSNGGEMIPDTEIATFLAKGEVKYDGTYERLMHQKYISLFWVGYEAWHDYRRTGQPELKMGSATENSHTMPSRLLYPEITKSSNGKNCEDAAARMGGDNMLTKLWWAK